MTWKDAGAKHPEQNIKKKKPQKPYFWYQRKKHTSALKTSKANPLKQLITACWMSNPRLSRVLIVESKRPGLRAQNMWILTALPSLTLTSTYKIQKQSKVQVKPMPWITTRKDLVYSRNT